MSDREAKVKEAIRRWEENEQTVANLKQALSHAETDRNNARNAVGKLITPPDAKSGEHFQVCVGERWLVVSVNNMFDYLLSWRKP